MESPFWWSAAAGDVHVAFTSVAAGNLSPSAGDPSLALRNRHRLAEQLGAVPRFLSQVHSSDVLDADAAAADPTGDAWVSVQGAPLGILVADCLPVLFAGHRPPGQLVTAAAHAGRGGLLAGVLENTVTAMTDRGAQDITAWIGPGACGSCYEIPSEMVEALAADRPAIRSRTSWGTAALNLRAEAQAVLQAAGVNVVDVFGCTIEDPLLFSHRRSQQAGEPVGRQAAVIVPAAGRGTVSGSIG